MEICQLFLHNPFSEKPSCQMCFRVQNFSDFKISVTFPVGSGSALELKTSGDISQLQIRDHANGMKAEVSMAGFGKHSEETAGTHPCSLLLRPCLFCCLEDGRCHLGFWGWGVRNMSWKDHRCQTSPAQLTSGLHLHEEEKNLYLF